MEEEEEGKRGEGGGRGNPARFLLKYSLCDHSISSRGIERRRKIKGTRGGRREEVEVLLPRLLRHLDRPRRPLFPDVSPVRERGEREKRRGEKKKRGEDRSAARPQYSGRKRRP